MTLFDLLRIEYGLSQLTRRKIDLVDDRAVKPLLKKYIFAQTISLLQTNDNPPNHP